MRGREIDCLDAAVLIGQETNPTGPRHRFGADDSVLPTRVPYLDRYRLCHVRGARSLERERERERYFILGILHVIPQGIWNRANGEQIREVEKGGPAVG